MSIPVRASLPTPAYETYCNLVAVLLHATLSFHAMHLMATTLPVHQVLGDIYTRVDKAADQIAESLAGTAGALHLPSQPSPPVSGDPMLVLDALLSVANSSKAGNAALDNVIDELVGDLSQARYLLSLAQQT